MLKTYLQQCSSHKSVFAQCRLCVKARASRRRQFGTRVYTYTAPAPVQSGSQSQGQTQQFTGPNAKLIQKLTKGEQEAESVSELQQERDGAFKARALRRAIGALSLHPEAITSGQDAMKIIGVGEGIARRIDEYFQQEATKSIDFDEGIVKRRIDEFRHDPGGFFNSPSLQLTERDHALAELKRVPGIGSVKALKLYEAGCRTLADLRKPEYLATLSAPVRVSLEYVDHLQRRVAREQIEAVMKRIRSLTVPELRYHLVGSYRRGTTLSTAIELIVFHSSCVYVPRPDEKPSSDLRTSASGKSSGNGVGRPPKHVSASRKRQDSLLREFVLNPLERGRVVAATLSECARRWSGVVQLPGQPPAYRRMTITLFPLLSEGAALLATTGDNDFQAYLRRRASSPGLHLDEFGLWRWVASPDKNGSPTSSRTGKKSSNEEDGRWELVVSRTEEEILSELGLEYVEPEERNFSFVISKGKEGSVLKQPQPASGPKRTHLSSI